MENSKKPINFNKIKKINWSYRIKTLEKRIKKQILLLEEITNPNFKNIIVPLDSLLIELENITDFFNIYSSLIKSKKINKIQHQAHETFSGLKKEVFSNPKLYLLASQINSNYLSEVDSNLLEIIHQNFHNYGTHLTPIQKSKLSSLESREAHLIEDYHKKNLDSKRKIFYLTQENEVLGLPFHFVNEGKKLAKKLRKKGWAWYLSEANYNLILKCALNRNVRKKIFIMEKSRLQKGKNNVVPTVSSLIEVQHKISNLLGYENIAQSSLSNCMINDSENVKEFLNKITKSLTPLVKEEKKQIDELAKPLNISNIQPWDEGFLISLYSKNAQNELPVTFEEMLPRIFKIISRIFNITISKINVNTYEKEVQVFQIKKNSKTIAYWYIDPYFRLGKDDWSWVSDFYATPKDQIKHIAINYNFNKNEKLTLDEIRSSIVHELGHAIHYTFVQTLYYSHRNHNLPYDFIEMPSQLLENWFMEPKILREVLPEIKNLSDLLHVQRLGTVFEFYEQTYFSYLDIEIHTNNRKKLISIEKDTKKLFKLLIKSNHYTSPTIDHLWYYGYGSTYYSFLWSNALESQIFDKFKKYGLFNKKLSSQFVNQLLKPGSSINPLKLFYKFTKQKPSTKYFLNRIYKSKLPKLTPDLK